MSDEIAEILVEVKKLARKYKKLTGKTLEVTGEVAELYAAQFLGVDLTGAHLPGYDAVKEVDGETIRYQIMGRSSDDISKGPVGSIRKETDYDYVVLVLMNEDYDVQSIYQALRSEIDHVLRAGESKSRNIRRQLSINKFKAIGQKVWPI